MLSNNRSLTRAQRRQAEKLTPPQKYLQIRKMYQALDTHLVKGAKDTGVTMDMEEFNDFVKTPCYDAKLIDQKYRRMVTVYGGVRKDVQEYVDSRYAEIAEARKQLDISEYALHGDTPCLRQ